MIVTLIPGSVPTVRSASRDCYWSADDGKDLRIACDLPPVTSLGFLWKAWASTSASRCRSLKICHFDYLQIQFITFDQWRSCFIKFTIKIDDESDGSEIWNKNVTCPFVGVSQPTSKRLSNNSLQCLILTLLVEILFFGEIDNITYASDGSR